MYQVRNQKYQKQKPYKPYPLFLKIMPDQIKRQYNKEQLHQITALRMLVDAGKQVAEVEFGDKADIYTWSDTGKTMKVFEWQFSSTEEIDVEKTEAAASN